MAAGGRRFTGLRACAPDRPGVPDRTWTAINESHLDPYTRSPRYTRSTSWEDRESLAAVGVPKEEQPDDTHLTFRVPFTAADLAAAG
jgi:hypothetical protein